MNVSTDAATVAVRVATLQERIRAAGGVVDAIELIGVTKGFAPDVVDVALRAGLTQLGENYAQELLGKVEWMSGRSDLHPVTWHFIGHLQRNKVRDLAPHVALWQSIDRPELVATLARHAPGAALLVQVNTTAEPQKAGCTPGAIPAIVEQAEKLGLRVRGLMTVGPTDSMADPRPAFAKLRCLVDRFGLAVCSMGMSDDLEHAVSEGTNMVRIGRALFGPRPA